MQLFYELKRVLKKLSFSTLKRVRKGHGSHSLWRESILTKPEKVKWKCIRDYNYVHYIFLY